MASKMAFVYQSRSQKTVGMEGRTNQARS
jgi:hypothetical protein